MNAVRLVDKIKLVNQAYDLEQVLKTKVYVEAHKINFAYNQKCPINSSKFDQLLNVHSKAFDRLARRINACQPRFCYGCGDINRDGGKYCITCQENGADVLDIIEVVE